MATTTKYNAFIQDLGRKKHDLDADTLKLALTNTAPNAATHALLADITEIGAGNGYSAGGAAIGSSDYTQTSGTGKLTGDDVVITASGGTIGPFRYGVIYNDTAAGDPLIGYIDRGSSITLNDGESVTFDVDATNGYVQLA